MSSPPACGLVTPVQVELGTKGLRAPSVLAFEKKPSSVTGYETKREHKHKETDEMFTSHSVHLQTFSNAE